MKILMFGAGVLGSLYAAKLHEAGHDITLLARGQRLKDLREHGVLLEEFQSKEKTVTAVPIVENVAPDESYDVCVVMVRKDQLQSALQSLTTMHAIAAFLFMANSADDASDLVAALGRDRVLLGHVNAGGERDGPLVRYMTAEKMTLGELDGQKSKRLRRIASVFTSAGFPVELSRDMEAWKRCHVAIGVPMCNALYRKDCDNYKLAKDKKVMRQFVHGLREGLAVMRGNDIAIEPAKLRLVRFMPDALLVAMMSKVFGSELFDIGGARHARAARGEMEQLSEDLIRMAHTANVKIPTLRKLHQDAFGQTA